MTCMTEQPTARVADTRYRERLTPGPGLFVAWLLIIPASALVMIPMNSAAAIPVALGVYAIIALLLLSMSPVIDVHDGVLTAGRAQIPVTMLGDIEPLGSAALSRAIGPEADARDFLLVRGWIRKGLKIEVVDPTDPTPHWIITSRKPLALAEAIRAQAGQA